MRKFLACLLISTMAFPYGALATSTDPMSADHPAFAAINAKIPTTVVVPADPDTNGLINGTVTKTVSPSYLSVAQSEIAAEPQRFAGCNPVIWAAMKAHSQTKIVNDTANAAAAHNAIAYGMNNDCNRKFGTNGQASSSVDAAIMAKREKELNTIEQAICNLNFNSLLSGMLGLNLTICKGGKLIGGGINDTLSGTYLNKAHDLRNETACLQPKATTTNTMNNVTSPNGYGMTAASGGLGVLNAAGLQPGGGNGWNFGFGTTVSTGVNVSNGNVNTTGTTTPTTPTSNTPVVAPTPPSSSSGVTSGAITGTGATSTSNIYK